MAQINFDSFLTFFDSDGEELLPQPYDGIDKWCNPEVWVVSGESYALYIKAIVPAIGSITDGTNTYGVTSSATSIVALSETHTVLTFSIGSIPSGTYWFTAGSYKSQTVMVASANDAKKDSVLIEFHQRLSLGNFWYPYTDSNFKNKVRVRMIWLGDENFEEKAVYRTSADGNSVTSKFTSVYGTVESFSRFKVEDYRDYIHRAMFIMRHHKNIKISGIDYFYRPDGAYTKESDGTKLSSAEFALTRQKSLQNLKT